MNLYAILVKLAERHGVSTDADTIRGRQIGAWCREFDHLTDSQCEAVWNSLSACDDWPKYHAVRAAVSAAKRPLAIPGSVDGCHACRDTGWIAFRRLMPDGKHAPWSAACLCPLGQRLSSRREHDAGSIAGGAVGEPVRVQPVDRELYEQRLRENDPECDNHPNSTPERRAAAMAYIVASVQTKSDPDPINMVDAILRGERDDVVRSLSKRGRKLMSGGRREG